MSVHRRRTATETGAATRTVDAGAVVDLRVAQLICSRLCHDLAGAIGAAANGLQLLDTRITRESGATVDDTAVQLIGDCVGEAGRRLAFYRVAFGAGGLPADNAPLAEAQRLAHGWLAGSRVSLVWPETAPSDTAAWAGDAARLTLCLVLLASESLRRGGTVSVRTEQPSGGNLIIDVAADGPSVHFADDRRRAFDSPDPDALTVRSVDAYYTNRLAQRLGGAIIVGDDGGSRVRFTARLAC
jgi:histidine phosphotransferase ChpT